MGIGIGEALYSITLFQHTFGLDRAFHNLLFNGPPGSGKTLLARCLPSILPKMSTEEALEVTKVYSVSGALRSENPLILQRPFRVAPLHNLQRRPGGEGAIRGASAHQPNHFLGWVQAATMRD